MFKTEITFLPVNNYPDAHHSQGGMKFATQISPLLNYQVHLLTLTCKHRDSRVSIYFHYVYWTWMVFAVYTKVFVDYQNPDLSLIPWLVLPCLNAKVNPLPLTAEHFYEQPYSSNPIYIFFFIHIVYYFSLELRIFTRNPNFHSNSESWTVRLTQILFQKYFFFERVFQNFLKYFKSLWEPSKGAPFWP